MIRLSTARLFTFRRSTRERRSRTERKGLSLRASRMASIAEAPSPLIAERPKRIARSDGKKAYRDSFTSGGRIGIPFSRQNAMYLMILSVSPDSEVIRALKYSTG